MTNFAMQKGASGWADQYNKFVAAHTDTNWQSTGITYLNGWKQDPLDPIQYRTITIGDLVMIEIGGWVSGPAMSATSNITDICTLPDAVVKYFTDSYNTKVTIGQATKRAISGNASVSDGKLHFVIYGNYALTAGDGFWVGLLAIVAAKQ